MAIKIIKDGTKERKAYRAECQECGCIFEYHKEDIRIRYTQEYGFSSTFTGEEYYVDCPQCHNECRHL